VQLVILQQRNALQLWALPARLSANITEAAKQLA